MLNSSWVGWLLGLAGIISCFETYPSLDRGPTHLLIRFLQSFVRSSDSIGRFISPAPLQRYTCASAGPLDLRPLQIFLNPFRLSTATTCGTSRHFWLCLYLRVLTWQLCASFILTLWSCASFPINIILIKSVRIQFASHSSFVVIWFDRRRAAAWLRVPCGGWLWTTRRFNYLHQVWTTIAVHTRSLVFGPTSLPALLIVTTIAVHTDSLASCPLSCLYYSSSFTFGTCDWFSFWHQQSCSGVCLETIQCGRSYWSECASHRRASGLAHKTATPSVSLEERAHYGVEFLEYWAEYRR